MSVHFPIFAFENDDRSIRLIEEESGILYQLEAIDIGNHEYVFWDANGDGVTIAVSVGAFKSSLESVSPSPAAFPIHDAFILYARSLGLPESAVEGTPVEAWRRIQVNLTRR